jgi:LysM domain
MSGLALDARPRWPVDARSPVSGGGRPARPGEPGRAGVGSRGPRQARPPGGLRLTRRGRAVVVLVATLILAAMFSLGRASTMAASDLPAPAAPLRTMVAAPGDTLWSIASRAEPGRDPRRTVDAIRHLNRLPGATVQAGQQLLLPPR